MSYKSKILNPVTIVLKDDDGYILGNDGFSDTPLSFGAVFETDNYGINVIKQIGENYSVESYPTTSRIYSVSLENYANSGDKIVVIEIGTTIPWVFDLNGKLIQQSSFLSSSRRDLSYIRRTFGNDPDFNISKFFEQSDIVRDKKTELLVWSKMVLESKRQEDSTLDANVEEILKIHEGYVMGNQVITYDEIKDKVDSISFLKVKREEK